MGRVLAGICALFSAAMVGIWIRKRLTAKALFLEEFYAYLTFVSEKISYERMPLPEINRRFAERGRGAFVRFLQGEEVSIALPPQELREMREYLAGIGTSDADTQISSLQGKCSETKKRVEKDCVKYRKDGALYFKLSVLIGVVLFIVLV